RIYIVNDHHGPPEGRHDVGEWFLAAFDAQSGREVWRVHEMKVDAYGWSSPYVWQNELRTEIVTASNNQLRSYDSDGKLLWQLKGLSRNTTPTAFAAGRRLHCRP